MLSIVERYGNMSAATVPVALDEARDATLGLRATVDEEIEQARKQMETREEDMKKLAEVLAEQGVEGASVAAIAARAELRPGSLYFHFPSRTALVEAAIREAVGRASARVAEAVGEASGDPVAALRRAVGAHVRALDELGAARIDWNLG